MTTSRHVMWCAVVVLAAVAFVRAEFALLGYFFPHKERQTTSEQARSSYALALESNGIEQVNDQIQRTEVPGGWLYRWGRRRGLRGERAVIDLTQTDYPGFASASLDAAAPAREGQPGGLFARRVDVFVGAGHVVLTHYEWRTRLLGGPALRAAYLMRRGSLNTDADLVDFVEQAIRLHATSSAKAFSDVLAGAHDQGVEAGRLTTKAEIRKVLGIEECA